VTDVICFGDGETSVGI